MKSHGSISNLGLFDIRWRVAALNHYPITLFVFLMNLITFLPMKKGKRKEEILLGQD